MFDSILNIPDGNYKPLKLDFKAHKGDSEPTSPSYSPSVVKYGDTDISKTYKDPSGQIVTQYVQTPEEKQLMEWRKQQLAEYEPKINTWDDSTLQGFKATADANKQKNITAFKELYDPIRRDTRNDYFNRMGTLDSTAYLDRTNELDNTENKALSQIAEDSVAQEEALKDAELARRYQYLNYLQGSNSALDQNAYNAMNYSNTGSNSGNQFNLSNYQTQAALYQQKLAKQQAMWDALGETAATAGKFIPSDIKTKKNINKLGSINNINIYEFEYKTDKYPELPIGKHTGVIAQEIENIIPDAVTEINGIKHVYYDKVREFLSA